MNPSLENPEGGCPFCAIARGEDESVEVIAEEESWIAFFPIGPATPGHTLVIPRKHVPDLWAADPPLAAELTGAVIRIGEAIKKAVEPEGINLITSAGEAAEQTVFHLHLHLVPRWANDRLDIWPPRRSMAPRLKADLSDAVKAAYRGE